MNVYVRSAALSAATRRVPPLFWTQWTKLNAIITTGKAKYKQPHCSSRLPVYCLPWLVAVIRPCLGLLPATTTSRQALKRAK